MARNPIVFNNGTLVSSAKVEVDGVIYDVSPAQYEGTTPLSANNLNQLQTNLYDYVDEETNNVKSKYTQLWTGHTNSGTQVLNDSIENYDFILVVARGGGYTRGTTLIPVSLIEYGSGDTTPWSVVAFQTASVFGSLKLNFTNSTTISITEYHNNWTSGFLEEVIGIKL